MIAFLAALACLLHSQGRAEPQAGLWRAWLESPGGELPFALELARGDDGWSAVIGNGDERIEVPEVSLAAGRLVLALPEYAAEIAAAVEDGGARLAGAWTRALLGGTTSRLVFRAERWEGAGAPPRFAPLGEEPAGSVAGRWRARFESSDDDAVPRSEQAPDGRVSGSRWAGSPSSSTATGQPIASASCGTRGAMWDSEETPMLLHVFEHITRGALLRWWTSNARPAGEVADPS